MELRESGGIITFISNGGHIRATIDAAGNFFTRKISGLPKDSPTPTKDAHLGTNGAATLSGDDIKGSVTFSTDTTGVSAGSAVSVAFASTKPAAPTVFVSPGNAATALINPYVATVSATSFVIGFGTTPSTNQSSAYVVNYNAVCE